MQPKKRFIISIAVVAILLLGKQVFAEMPNLKLPFEGGLSWQVSGDYDISTHKYYGLWMDDDYALDFADTKCGSWNKPALAVAGGNILTADDIGSTNYGKQVVIDHGDGYRSRYTHLNSVSVKVGEKVVQGQEIGKVGNTGNVSGDSCDDDDKDGTHLHFALYKDGKACKPEPMSNYENFTYGVSYLSDNYFNPLTFTFDSALPQGFTCGYDTQEAREPQYGEWRVRVVNNPPTTNPGVKSPEYASGMMAKGAVIKFNAKVIGNDVPVNAKLYIKRKDGNWNNVVPIGTIGTDHAYHTYTADLSEATGSIPIDKLEIAQFSLELSDGGNGDDEYWYLAII